ncbi:hypothetical protein JCM11641_006282 [Rhodosporidiobolus odoratus]
MAGRARQDGEKYVGVYWDYENVRFPAQYSPQAALDAICDLALSKGILKEKRVYMETALERTGRTSHLRAELQQGGFSVIDAPHDGMKDVADKMLMTDMLVNALESPAPACNALRDRKVEIVLITTPSAHPKLRAVAHTIRDWRTDILKLPPTIPPAGLAQPQVRNKKKIKGLQKLVSATTSHTADASFFHAQTSTSAFAPYIKPVHSVLATHYAAPAARATRGMQPTFVARRSADPAPPAHSTVASALPQQVRQPSPLTPLDLTASDRKNSISSRAWSMDSHPGGGRPQLLTRVGSRKGKERAYEAEVLVLTDEEEEGGEEEAEGQYAGGQSSEDDDEVDILPAASRRDLSTPPRLAAQTRSRSNPTPRQSSYGHEQPPSLSPPFGVDQVAQHPTSTMDMEESEYGSPAGQIDVLYSLGKAKSSSSSLAGTAKKRKGESTSSVKGEVKTKRQRLPFPPREEDEEGQEDSSEEEEILAASRPTICPRPQTPYSARSAASSQYDLLTEPVTSDVASRLGGGKGKKGRGRVGLVRRAVTRSAGQSKLAREVTLELADREEEEEVAGSGSGDDPVVILSD